MLKPVRTTLWDGKVHGSVQWGCHVPRSRRAKRGSEDPTLSAGLGYHAMAKHGEGLFFFFF